jgi:hypothetical protein
MSRCASGGGTRTAVEGPNVGARAVLPPALVRLVRAWGRSSLLAGSWGPDLNTHTFDVCHAEPRSRLRRLFPIIGFLSRRK